MKSASRNVFNCAATVTRFVAAIVIAIAAQRASAQELFDGTFVSWSFDARDGDVESVADGRTQRLKNDDFRNKGRAYVRSLLEVSNTADKSAKIELNHTRKITSTKFKATEDCRLALFALMQGDYLRKDNGELEFEATVLVRNITDAKDAFKIDSASDKDRWKYVIKADADKKLDDSWLARVDILKGKEYEIKAELRAKETLAADKKGEMRFRIRDDANTNEWYLNLTAALEPKVKPDWRGENGIGAISARAKHKANDKNLTGTGIKVGVMEIAAAIADHKHLPRVKIIKDANFKDGDKPQFRGEHPTAVSGIIAATGGGDDKLAGVAPGASIVAMPLSSYDGATGSDEQKRIRVERGVQALIDDGAKTINVSWGLGIELAQATEEKLNEFLDTAIGNKGLSFIYATGNDGKDAFLDAPGSSQNGMRVSAVDRSMRRIAEFSTTRARQIDAVHIAAPGEWIQTTVVMPRQVDAKDKAKERRGGDIDDYDTVFQGYWLNGRGRSTTYDISGTSFSTPMVSGTVALMRELITDKRFDKVRSTYDNGTAFRAVLMASAWRGGKSKALRYRDNTVFDPEAGGIRNAQNFKVWKQFGAGLLWVGNALTIQDERKPIFPNLGGPEPDQEASIPPGGDILERMKFTGTYFVDVFAIQPYQQQEFAIIKKRVLGDEAAMAISWLRRFDDAHQPHELNLAVALYRDNDFDPSDPNQRIGSDEFLTPDQYTFTEDGVVFPETLGADTLITTADAGWLTNELLSHTIQSASDEGYYYFRVVNLTGDSDEFALAGIAGAGLGACCLPDESCAELGMQACADAGGEYGGSSSRCESETCAAPQACCIGQICYPLSFQQCIDAGGEYRGGSCDPNPCIAAVGACCYGDGVCVLISQVECGQNLGGVYQGDSSDCGSVDCPMLPEGACCSADESCSLLTPADCAFIVGGQYFGDGSRCEDVTCPPSDPVGSCCTVNGCIEVTMSDCEAADGLFGGPGSYCNLAPTGTIIVSNLLNDGDVVEIDVESGALMRTVAGMSNGVIRPNGVAIDADGNFYIASVRNDTVIKFEYSSAAELLSFNGGGLDAPVGIVVDAPSRLLVGSQLTNSVLAFDLSSGAFIDELVASGSGGLDSPGAMLLGPDGSLYVCSEGTNQVLVFAADSGEFVRIAAEGSPLEVPASLLLDGDDLLVASAGSDSVLRYGPDGAFVDTLVASGAGGLDLPVGMARSAAGNLWICSRRSHQILEFDGASGEFVRIISSDSALTAPQYLVMTQRDGDCNDNQIPDRCEIAMGLSSDENGDGIPDECQQPPGGPCDGFARGDSDGSGAVNFADIDCFVAALIGENTWLFCGTSAPPEAYLCVNDIDENGVVSFEDIDGFVECLINSGCP